MTFSWMSLVMILSYFVAPIYLLVKLWRNRSEDLFNWALLASFTTVFVIYMYRVAAWALVFSGYYWRYLVLIALPIVIVTSYRQSRRRLLPGWHSLRNLCTLLFIGFVCITSIIALYRSYKSSAQISEAVELDFPLKEGDYYIVQGGNDLLINHHHEVNAQKYAIDIVKLNRWGVRCNALFAPDLDHYNIFGTTVYGPCEGRIIRLVNEHDDLPINTMDEDHLAGNHIAIQIGDSNRIVVLAHLMKNTFLVKEGDLVVRGQPLAKVGNSGNTSEPHLHMHVVETTSDDLLFDEPGVPMKFNGQFLIRNQRI